jgi:hypothetical protein
VLVSHATPREDSGRAANPSRATEALTLATPWRIFSGSAAGSGSGPSSRGRSPGCTRLVVTRTSRYTAGASSRDRAICSCWAVRHSAQDSAPATSGSRSGDRSCNRWAHTP